MEISADLSTKPVVPELVGEPPAKMVIEDVVVGDGAVAHAGDHVTVHYVGVSYSTGRQFDASWDRVRPGNPHPANPNMTPPGAFDFPLGRGRVIAGWDEGVQGMRAGGRRTLIIPPDKGYGPRGMGPIKANETLVFVVDLLLVE